MRCRLSKQSSCATSTHCAEGAAPSLLPRDHRDCPRDLRLIPAHRRHRMTSPEQLWEGRWPCIMPDVRTLGQGSAKTFVCPPSLLSKSPNNHLPFFGAYKAPKGSNSWIQQPKWVLQTSACHKCCFPEPDHKYG